MHFTLHRLNILLSGTETRSIYVNGMIRSLAFGIAGVFIPIFLLENGLPLPGIGLFYVTQYLFFAIFALQNTFFEELLGGIKKMIIAGTACSAIFLATLGRVPVWMSAMLAGAGLGLYWVSVNTDFSLHVRKGKAGSTFGKWTSLASVPALFAPLLGGWLLDVIGFRLVLFISSGILALSLIPFVLSEDIFVRPRRKIREVLGGELSAEFILQGVVFIAFILWPVYIFSTGKDLLVVGGLSVLSSLALILFKYSYGRLADRLSRLALMKAGALLNAVVWVLAMLSEDVVSLSVVSVLLGFTGSLVGTPLFVFFSEYSKKDPLAWMSLREVSLCLGRITAALLFFWFPSFDFAFALAALASVGLAMVKPVHSE